MRLLRRRGGTPNERLPREATRRTTPETAAPRPLAAAGEPQRELPMPFVPRPTVLPPADHIYLVNERPRVWDAVVTASAPRLEGDRVTFVALPGGSIVTEEERAGDDLLPLARAIESELGRPYRATGVRQTATLWSISAVKIRVARFDAHGDELELAVVGGEHSLKVDGEPSLGRAPQLERLGADEGDSYVVRASRLQRDVWEVLVSAL